MKHWHGLVIALSLAVCFVILDQVPSSVVEKERVVFGLLAAMIVSAVEVCWLLAMDLSKTKAAQSTLNNSANATKQSIERIELDQKQLLSHLCHRIAHHEQISDVLTDGRINEHEMETRWLSLLHNLRSNYSATNYIRNIYGKPLAQAALLVQKAKKVENKNVRIQKLFIFDGEDELISSAQFLEEQGSSGIEICYLLKSELTSEMGRINNRDIHSLDFGIFDDKLILVWDLDAQRNVLEGRLLVDKEQIVRHKKFFEQIVELGMSFTRDRHALVTVPQNGVHAYADNVDSWRLPDGSGYTGDYANLDYALRLTTGWITQFGKQKGTEILASFFEGQHVGFSLLTGIAVNDRELYIAVHPRFLRKKIGARIVARTVEYGFKNLSIEKIHLKVRPKPQYRVSFYSKLGFKQVGDSFDEVVNGISTKFIRMEITRQEHLQNNSQAAR